jgi:lysophospholipase L1-like esterase
MKKWLVRLSFTLNAVVLLAFVAVWIAGQDYALEKFLKPSHDRWVSQFELLPVSPGDIVFLGDSITEGGAWEELFPGLPVRNRGIGGDVTDGVMNRLEQVVAGKPAKVFLLIGTNDLALAEKTPTEIAAGVEAIVDTINTRSPDTRVYVQSILPRAENYRDEVETLNRELENRVSGKATWIDLYPLFLDGRDGSIRDDYSNDELHLLGPGYLEWRDFIEPYVRGIDSPQALTIQ